MMLPVVVEQVRPEITYGLRASVLRPGLAPLQVRFPGDDNPGALHFAAYDRADRVVGVVAVLPEQTPDGRPGWRLRGMAVHPDERCSGVGRALLVRLFDGVARMGGGLLWCQARLPAAGFYARAGFATEGAPFDDPDFGRHVRMSRLIGPAERQDDPGWDEPGRDVLGWDGPRFPR
jgi:GNAT superfamily N-acetyltransferase